jgi:hypothetical protein
MFYNGETPPEGLFDAFLRIPGASGEAKTHDSFLSFVTGSGEIESDPNNRYVSLNLAPGCD